MNKIPDNELAFLQAIAGTPMSESQIMIDDYQEPPEPTEAEELAYYKSELTATRARLAELEGIAERLYRQIGSKENDDTVPAMLAYEAYEEEEE